MRSALTARHDTDNPNQPVLRWGMGMESFSTDCFSVHTTATASYEDVDGVTRRSVVGAFEFTTGSVEGAFSSTSVSTKFSFTE